MIRIPLKVNIKALFAENKKDQVFDKEKKKQHENNLGFSCFNQVICALVSTLHCWVILGAFITGVSHVFSTSWF